MNILVTGATGFIGKHLVRRLSEEGYNVKCLIRATSDISELEGLKGVDFVRKNLIGDLENVCRNITVVIHLAAQLGAWDADKEMYVAANVKATENILKDSIKNNTEQFIFCSTPGVQGLGKRAAKEEYKYNPGGLYEQTKVFAEKSVVQICRNSAIKYTIIRPDFVYGDGDIRRVGLYRSIKSGKFILTSNGKSFIHPTYIEDVIDGLLITITNERAYNEIFNIAAEQDLHVEEYLETIARKLGVKLKRFYIPYTLSMVLAFTMEQLINKTFGKESIVTRSKIRFLSLDHSSDITKAKKVLGYKPKYNIDEGLEKTIKWFQKRRLLD